jgi:hypothetical protein
MEPWWRESEKPPKDSPFKKQSIFFPYLPYWKEFEICHACWGASLWMIA